MQFYIQSLLSSLTTVFAWAPSAILLCMPIVGIYTGLLYIAEIGFLPIALLILLTITGGAGFIGLSAVCWHLKLRKITILLCLISGLISLILVIVIGFLSNNDMFQLGFSVVEVYLFMGPLFFLLLHIALLSKQLRQ